MRMLWTYLEEKEKFIKILKLNENTKLKNNLNKKKYCREYTNILFSFFNQFLLSKI